MVGAITSFRNIDLSHTDNLRAGFLNLSVKTSCFHTPVTGSRSKNLIISMGRIIRSDDINKNIGEANTIHFGLGKTAQKLALAKTNIIRAIISNEYGSKGISEDALPTLMAQITEQNLQRCTTIASLRDMARSAMDAFAAIPQQQEPAAEAPQNPKNAVADTQAAKELATKLKNAHLTAPKANPKNDNIISFMGGTLLQQVAKKGNGIYAPELKELLQKNIEKNEQRANLPLIDRSIKIKSTLIEKLHENIIDAKKFEEVHGTNDIRGKLAGEIIGLRKNVKIFMKLNDRKIGILKENTGDCDINNKAETIKNRFDSLEVSEGLQTNALGVIKYICENQDKEFCPKGTQEHDLRITLMKNADETVTLDARRGNVSLLTVSLNEQGEMTVGDGSGMNFPDDEPQITPDVRQQQNISE